MGAVNTTYTFTATDTITSSKMNNIIDQTTMTGDAIFGTTLEVADGKLKIRSQGITSNELAENSVKTIAIEDANITTAKLADANVIQTKLGPNVVGNGPCFSVEGIKSVTNGSQTKIDFTIISWDTKNNISSSRFTPTIAGYYLFTGRCSGATRSLLLLNCYIYKNGGAVIYGSVADTVMYISSASGMLYMNGTTDYVEIYTGHSTAGTYDVRGYLDGVLVRSA
jgi:hypothetical protein